jgi:hypothetical protein
MTMTIHAPTHSQRVKGWLSRDGESIFFKFLGSTESVRFEAPGTAPDDSSPWEAFDRILRSTGK